jgi:hypothetical protein
MKLGWASVLAHERWSPGVSAVALGSSSFARGAAPRLTYGAVSSIISSEFMA